MVYLDPRFTKTAAKATEWLPIRPGTDLAFHLALINVIIGEELYNQHFVDQYTVGFDELPTAVSTVHARMGGGHHRDPGRHHPAHRT